jgi:hypothetical protein
MHAMTSVRIITAPAKLIRDQWQAMAINRVGFEIILCRAVRNSDKISKVRS